MVGWKFNLVGVGDMRKYVRSVMSLKTDRRGVTAVEYGIVAALIATGLVTAVTSVGTQLSTVFQNLAETLGAAKPTTK